MAINKMSGRNAIALLKEVFNIEQERIRAITIHAPCDDIATITVDGILCVNDIDITTEEISKDTTHKAVTYEVTIKEVTK